MRMRLVIVRDEDGLGHDLGDNTTLPVLDRENHPVVFIRITQNESLNALTGTQSSPVDVGNSKQCA